MAVSAYPPALLLGLVAAMRTWTPVAAASFHLARADENPLKGTLLSPLASPLSTVAAGAIAAGELVVDKLPIVPHRIRADAWASRIVAGAVAGAAWERASGRTGVAGAVIGGGTAAVATYALYHLRRAAGRHLPDLLLGLVEDAAALCISSALLTSNASRQ